MKLYNIDFLPIPVEEARKLREKDGAVIPICSWKNLEAEGYYPAYNQVLSALQTTKFAKEFKKKYKKPLGIAHIIKYLEITVVDDKRYNKPKNGYIRPLMNELKKEVIK